MRNRGGRASVRLSVRKSRFRPMLAIDSKLSGIAAFGPVILFAPVSSSRTAPALITRCSSMNCPPLRRHFPFKWQPGGCTQTGSGLLRIRSAGVAAIPGPAGPASAGFLPAVAWIGSPLRDSPVWSAGGAVYGTCGPRSPFEGGGSLVPGRRSRCLTRASERIGFGICRYTSAARESGARLFVSGSRHVREACARHFVRDWRESESPRWEKRPLGPFPSVGASRSFRWRLSSRRRRSRRLALRARTSAPGRRSAAAAWRRGRGGTSRRVA